MCSGKVDVREPVAVHRLPESLPANANVSGIENVILVLAVPQARADYLGRPELDANEGASERERVADQTFFNRIERSSVEKKSLGSELLLRAAPWLRRVSL